MKRAISGYEVLFIEKVTYTGAELDYVKEQKGKLYGYEIKWKKSSKASSAWLENYKENFKDINKDNFLKFTCSN